MNALQIISYIALSFVIAYMIAFILGALVIYLRYFFWKVRLKRKYKKTEKYLKQVNKSMPPELKKAMIRFKYFKDLAELTNKPISDYDKTIVQISPTAFASKNYFEELSEDDKKLAYKATQQILQALKLEKEDSNNDNTSTTNTEPK